LTDGEVQACRLSANSIQSIIEEVRDEEAVACGIERNNGETRVRSSAGRMHRRLEVWTRMIPWYQIMMA